MSAKRARSHSNKKRSSEAAGLDRWSQTTGKASSRTSANVHGSLYALGALVVILIIALIVSFPINTSISRGLDVSSGTALTFTATKSDGSAPTEEELATTTDVLEKRLEDLGFSDARVVADGSTVTAQIPGTAVDAQQLGTELAQTGQLEFVRLDEIGDADALALINAGQTNVPLEAGTYTPFLDGSTLTSASVSQTTLSGTSIWLLNFSFNEEGAAVLAEVTQDLAANGGQLAVVLDGRVISAPAVQQAITEGDVSLSGGFTEQQAQSIEMVVASGSLPINLTFTQSAVQNPVLGREALTQGICALAVGAVLVAILLVVRYHALALLVFGSIVVSVLVWVGCSAVLSRVDVLLVTLPALAGLAYTALIACADSLLVLERFMEEVRKGRSLRTAATTGLSHTSVSLVEACLVLFVAFFIPSVVATGSVREFALSATAGTAAALIALLLFEKPLLQVVVAKSMKARPSFWGVELPGETAESVASDVADKQDQVATANAKPLAIVSLALLVVAVAGCVVQSGVATFLGEVVLATPVLGVSLAAGLLVFVAVMTLRLDYKMALSSLAGVVFAMVVVLGISAWLNFAPADQLAAGLLFTFAWTLWCAWTLLRRVSDDLAQERKANKNTAASKGTLWEKMACSVKACGAAPILSLAAVIVISVAILIACGMTLFTMAVTCIIGAVVGVYAQLGVALPLIGAWKIKEPQWATVKRRQTRHDK